MQRIYLDHNATTPLDPRVVEAMTGALAGTYGNPSSLHWFGQQARAAVEEARESVARLVGAQPAEIVFTASGTEADNMALRGVALAQREPRGRLLVSAIEHHAVLHCARALAEEGWPVETVRVTSAGLVDLEDLERKREAGAALVAVMLANNETGVVQPLGDVVRLAHARGALVLCDAVQAVGKLSVDVRALDIDLLALSAHKFYGPKGVGALYVRRGTRLKAFVRGGAQERNRRAGTENVAGVVGLGCAARIAREELAREPPREAVLRDALEERLLAIAGARRNGDGARVSNTTNLSFDGIEAESLVMALDLAGLAVSSGAACAAGAVEPSHVLRAMGLPPALVQASVRFSLGRGTTREEIEEAAALVEQAVARQRARRR